MASNDDFEWDDAKAAKEFRRSQARQFIRVTPAVVVNEARPKKSPIHDDFEWDDAKAAKEFRLSQARQFIRVTPA